MRRLPMHMADWAKKLDAFLTLNVLTHAGPISHEMALSKAERDTTSLSRSTPARRGRWMETLMRPPRPFIPGPQLAPGEPKSERATPLPTRS